MLKQVQASAPQEYGRYQQHAGLINDPLRVAAYNYAIRRSPPGQIALDIGSGSGILSLIALNHGYKHVILIEPSEKLCAYAAYLLDKSGHKGKYTIIKKSFESAVDHNLPPPQEVDLLMTETVSSLGVGFGCWPELLKYATRMRPSSIKIPHSVQVYLGLSTKDYSHSFAGTELLKEIGLDIDLAARTFWSGGNVSNKARFNEAMENREISLSMVLEMILGETNKIQFSPIAFTSDDWSISTGIVSFFEISLIKNDTHSRLSSNDEKLHSWSPCYFPFKNDSPSPSKRDGNLILKMIAGDNPYPYYFQFYYEEESITHPLLW